MTCCAWPRLCPSCRVWLASAGRRNKRSSDWRAGSCFPPTTRGTRTSRRCAVDPRSTELIAQHRARPRRCIPTSARSRTARRTASRTCVVDSSQPRVPVSFEYADESDPGPYPIPPDAPIEGGADSTATGTSWSSTATTGSCTSCSPRIPTNGGASWHAGSGAIFDLQLERAAAGAAGPRPTRPGCRSCPAWCATTKWSSRARSSTRCASRCSARRRAYVPPARHFASQLHRPEPAADGHARPPEGVRRLSASSRRRACRSS